MATFCLTKQASDNFKRALRDRELDPFKMATMESGARRDLIAKYVGAENAKQVNALFESKVLLKNQKAGYISWAKRVSGITPDAKRDLLSKIEKLDKVLSPAEEEVFLNDLAEKRLGFGVNEAEAGRLSNLSNAVVERRSVWEAKVKNHPEWDKNPAKTKHEWMKDEDRLKYGMSKVLLEEYVNELKLSGNKKRIIDKVADLPGAMKSAVASLDNSFWGRQGLKVLANPRTTDIWVRNFVKSFKDIGKQLFAKGNIFKSGDDAVINAIKADIYSRPNALNGKYKAGKYGLDVLSEEAYPSSLPEKIPLLGRLFKTSEVAYNGAALRLRADLADRFISIAEKQGINTLDPEQARGIGMLVSSLTGRGSIGKAEVLGKEINTVAFSIKFLKSNFDQLVAHTVLNKGATPFTKKEAGKNLLGIVATIASTLTIAKMLDKDSVDEDPRSTNFGRIKIFGQWTDITGGMASLVTLASRLTPTVHNGEWGFWTKKSSGEFRKLNSGEYGAQTALDIFDTFWQGKLSPFAGIFRDVWKGTDYQGNVVTPQGLIGNSIIPLTIQNWESFNKNPAASFVLGSMILESVGFSVASNPQPNTKSKIIPEGQKVSNNDFIGTVMVYAEALGKDPETTFDRMFTGQTIRKVSGGAVIVERMPLSESQKIKKEKNANNPEMKLDHTIPLELGGSNDRSNLKLVTTTQWRGYTQAENALGKALKAGKVSKSEAQRLVIKMKSAQSREEYLRVRKAILDKY